MGCTASSSCNNDMHQQFRKEKEDVLVADAGANFLNHRDLSAHFAKYRSGTVGLNSIIDTNNGEQKLLYADWTASGRLYHPIEQTIVHEIGPFMANTHTETSFCGRFMMSLYEKSKQTVKNHVNANDCDILIADGFGMTSVINRLHRILGIRVPEQLTPYTQFPDEMRPVVLITHMEHHSNQTSWLETIAIVEVVEPDENGLVSLDNFLAALKRHVHRSCKIASVTACSNVTGVRTPYHEIAKIMHSHGGFCFVDFACSFGYVDVDMHPLEESDDAKTSSHLDAIFFSPHKLLGGPGSSGIMILNKALYQLCCPSNVGGGILNWTNPWKEHSFVADVEAREEAGTPGILQMIRVGLAITLKESMTVKMISAREKQINDIVFEQFSNSETISILAGHLQDRLSIFSIAVKGLHYNLLATLLNDRYGIQVRGGCSCAGTYGHYLFGISQKESKALMTEIDRGDLINKPGWVRISLHPIMTDEEVRYICDSVKQVAANHTLWGEAYEYSSIENKFTYYSRDRTSTVTEEWDGDEDSAQKFFSSCVSKVFNNE